MIRVREYACLTTNTVDASSLDLAQIDKQTFAWLCHWIKVGEKNPFSLRDPNTLKLGSYVGYMESPSGIGIEVLPKTKLGEEDPDHGRRTLRKMLSASLNINNREAESAALARSNLPMHEWIFSQFLKELKQLLGAGLRGEYSRVSEISPFIRGQLDLSRQQRQPPGTQHLFHINHDVFVLDRIENRLIKTALQIVVRFGKSSEVWRMANEFNHKLDELKPLNNAVDYLPKWRNNKLMQGYQRIKPWCSLILERLNPDFQKGAHRGISLLFPMEVLFESYVGVILKKSITRPWKLKLQACSAYLLTHKAEGSQTANKWFQLKPDFLLSNEINRNIADAKWKLIASHENNTFAKYGLSQSDMYQMFAYGTQYQSSNGHMLLIYPKHAGFQKPLPVFSFSDSLHLWVVPLCIEKGKVENGDWSEYFACFQKKLEFEGTSN
jgi:5-methylcytosine-specific restriction enzyme subunit McrC